METAHRILQHIMQLDSTMRFHTRSHVAALQLTLAAELVIDMSSNHDRVYEKELSAL